MKIRFPLKYDAVYDLLASLGLRVVSGKQEAASLVVVIVLRAQEVGLQSLEYAERAFEEEVEANA
jgi:hypothetical protein